MGLTAAIIPAAGSGSRMGLDHPKQFHFIAGSPMLVHTVRIFLDACCIDMVVVVVPADSVASTEKMFAEHGLSGNMLQVTAGGKRRQDSVKAGLACLLSHNPEIVLIHDGARPLVDSATITRCLEGAKLHGAAIAAIPVKDTLKKAGSDLIIQHTVDRKNLWQAQTPQAVRIDLLRQAYEKAANSDVTDEASLLELAGISVQLVEGSETNIKITRPDDLIIAERIMQNNTAAAIRIGHGYDAHQFAAGRSLILGGITVPFELGLAGHSDADVLTHALCDAILGAIGAGDIGRHFPDSDKKFDNIYSIKLLEKVILMAKERNYHLSNADITLICQKPKISPHITAMRECLASACMVGTGPINIKATTTEKMGFIGRAEGIACHAVVLLCRPDTV